MLFSRQNIFFGSVLAASLAGHTFLLVGGNFFYEPPRYTVELAANSMEVLMVNEDDISLYEIISQESETEQDEPEDREIETEVDEVVEQGVEPDQDKLIEREIKPESQETGVEQDDILSQETQADQDEIRKQEQKHAVQDALPDQTGAIKEKIREKHYQKKKEQKSAYVEPTRGAVEEIKLDTLKNAAPLYPKVAREKGWEGTVILKVLIQANGRPGQILVDKSSGHSILDESALKAVQNWQFFPKRIANITIASWIKVPIRFSLEEKDERRKEKAKHHGSERREKEVGEKGKKKKGKRDRPDKNEVHVMNRNGKLEER